MTAKAFYPKFIYFQWACFRLILLKDLFFITNIYRKKKGHTREITLSLDQVVFSCYFSPSLGAPAYSTWSFLTLSTTLLAIVIRSQNKSNTQILPVRAAPPIW